MSSDESFAEFLARLDSNDPWAGTEVFERYVEQLVRLAAPRLVGAIRQKVDPEDVVQSAIGSFFRRNSRDAFKFESWDDLWAILATLTLRKCRFLPEKSQAAADKLICGYGRSPMRRPVQDPR